MGAMTGEVRNASRNVEKPKGESSEAWREGWERQEGRGRLRREFWRWSGPRRGKELDGGGRSEWESVGRERVDVLVRVVRRRAVWCVSRGRKCFEAEYWQSTPADGWDWVVEVSMRCLGGALPLSRSAR